MLKIFINIFIKSFCLILLVNSAIAATDNAQETSSKKPRIALIIGNASYEKSPLKNPVNDANDIAQELSTLGFSVILKIDANNKEMRNAVRELGEKLRDGGIGLFYFSGHGIQSKNRNFLVPINADIQNEADIEFEALDADYVLRQMEEANNGVNIIILDACRDSPFNRSFRSGLRGLARMDSLRGSLIAYATAPGNVAEDGTGRNGTYTKHLLTALKTMSSRSITELFTEVGAKVQEETKGQQIPWQSVSLTQNFCLKTCNSIHQPNNATTSEQSSLDFPGKYPEASVKALTLGDLKKKSPMELKIMRNEIFARYGYIFGDSQIQDYFNQQSWYKPSRKDVSDILTEIEKENIEFIRLYEKDQAKPDFKITAVENKKNEESERPNEEIKQLIQLVLKSGGMGHEEEIAFIVNHLESQAKLVHGDRKTARKNNEQGLEALRQENVENAIQFFLAGYKADSADTEVLNNLGYAYLLNNNPLAEKYLLQVLQSSPKRVSAWANLGHWYAQTNKLDESIACFSMAYRFSANRSKTTRFLYSEANKNPAIKPAIEQMFALKWIKTDLTKLEGLGILVAYPNDIPKELSIEQVEIADIVYPMTPSKGFVVAQIDEEDKQYPNYSIKFSNGKDKWFKLESSREVGSCAGEFKEYQGRIRSELFGDHHLCIYPGNIIFSEWVLDQAMVDEPEDNELDHRGRHHRVESHGLTTETVVKVIESLQPLFPEQ